MWGKRLSAHISLRSRVKIKKLNKIKKATFEKLETRI